MEKHYYVDDEWRVGLVIGGEMMTTLSAGECLELADELVGAGETLVQADGGTDDDDTLTCPRCGEPIRSVTISGPDGAQLHPCGYVIPPDHPVLSHTETDN